MTRLAIVVPSAAAAQDQSSSSDARERPDADRLVETLTQAGVTLVPCEDEPAARACLLRGEVDAVLLDAGAERAARARLRHLAHELRGSLALVRGHAELLDDILSSSQRESVKSISEAVLRLAALVDEQIEPDALP